MTSSFSTPRRPLACLLFVLFGLAVWPATVHAADDVIRVGTRFEELTVGAKTFRRVEVRSITARTVMIVHSGGMASIKLRDLAPEWQTRFGYDADAEATADQTLRTAPTAPPRRVSAPLARRTALPAKISPVEQSVRNFGQPASVNAEVDLRPKFFELELTIKSQGRRPSCAVFAIVSALEFQNAELRGKAEKFSEEYLIWATRKTLQRIPSRTVDDAPDSEDADEGFALSEVVAALRGYGIPLQASMPNTFGRSMAGIEDPPESIIDEARDHQRVSIVPIPGRDNITRINNLVHALNAGVPVPVGLAWPHYRTIRGGGLSAQIPIPGAGHAVTLVGYSSPSGRIEDVFFAFRNSWGPRWGQGGYGTVTYDYLLKHLHGAVLLDVQRARE